MTNRWKNTFLTFFTLLLSSFSLPSSANSTKAKMYSAAEVEKFKQTWMAENTKEQQKRLAQREAFLQLESLLNSKNDISAKTLALAESLRSSLADYPLIEEVDGMLFNAALQVSIKNNTFDLTQSGLTAFMEKYPDSAKHYRLTQLPFEPLYAQKQFEALIAYAQKHPPVSAVDQCRLFSAQFATSNQAEKALSDTAERQKALKQFDSLWLTTGNLPTECDEVTANWRENQFLTVDKIKQKAVNLFQQKNKEGWDALIAEVNTDKGLSAWLRDVNQLLNEASSWQKFAENQPLTDENKTLILAAFPAFVRTLNENPSPAEFQRYQQQLEQWQTKWQLTEEERRRWQITLISRWFDSPNETFQQWRDEQITQLKADNLTERRLRMAIWQKTPLNEWLTLLSDEAKNKQEWRYWAAKNDPQAKEKLTALSNERGFYPMLAAQALGQTYQVKMLTSPTLNREQQQKWQTQLDRITEWRALKRISKAKNVWLAMLQAVNFDEKLALSHFATQQGWFDLAVEATIQAKAWDYIALRLPNAYADWFALHLKDKAIRPSFAMAIARQESAWNPQAKSHANAMGLMQMLPTTAAETAKNQQLVYLRENDLFDPFRNIMLGTAHLDELHQKYPDNRILIAAAYNAGAHRVSRWLARSKGQLAMDEFIASIPFLETRDYVQNVLAYDYYYQVLQKKSERKMFSDKEQSRLY